jgi:hypothetical protein
MYSLVVTRLEKMNLELQCMSIVMEDPWFHRALIANNLTQKLSETYTKTNIENIKYNKHWKHIVVGNYNLLQIEFRCKWMTQNARTSSLVKNKTRKRRAITSFETQTMKDSSEIDTNIFVNGLLDEFRLAIMQDQPLSSSHPRNNDKRFKV